MQLNCEARLSSLLRLCSCYHTIGTSGTVVLNLGSPLELVEESLKIWYQDSTPDQLNQIFWWWSPGISILKLSQMILITSEQAKNHWSRSTFGTIPTRACPGVLCWKLDILHRPGLLTLTQREVNLFLLAFWNLLSNSTASIPKCLQSTLKKIICWTGKLFFVSKMSDFSPLQ